MFQRIKNLKASHILLLLLTADLFYILLHIFHKVPIIEHSIPIFEDEAFSISQDRGLAESFSYIQELWIALLFGWLIFKHRKPQYTVWSLLFVYFLGDDMFGIHEWMGDHLGPLFGSLFANTPLKELKLDSVGELAGLALVGLTFFLILYLSYRKSDPQTQRAFRITTLLVALLLFFGVALDFADTLLPNIEKLKAMARLVEDGGEMLAMSLILWYTYLLAGMDSAQPAGISAL